MKKFAFVVLATITPFFFACQDQAPATKVPPIAVASAKVSVVANQAMEITIEGMTCAIGCAATIQKKLNATTGISSATVDFATKKALILFDDKQIQPTAIREIVPAVGAAYSVSAFEILDR